MPGQTTQVAEWRQEDPGIVQQEMSMEAVLHWNRIYENGIMNQFGGYVIAVNQPEMFFLVIIQK